MQISQQSDQCLADLLQREALTEALQQISLSKRVRETRRVLLTVRGPRLNAWNPVTAALGMENLPPSSIHLDGRNCSALAPHSSGSRWMIRVARMTEVPGGNSRSSSPG